MKNWKKDIAREYNMVQFQIVWIMISLMHPDYNDEVNNEKKLVLEP
jgi:hypothetical protein